MEDEQQQSRKRIRRTTLDQLEEGRVFPETFDRTDQSYCCCNGQDCFCSSSEDEDEEEIDGYSYTEIQSGPDDDFSDFDCDFDYEQGFQEDEIDPDELSYEELIALGEMVGEENRGLSEADINRHLQPLLTSNLSSILLLHRCVICQMEFQEEDKERGENLPVTLDRCHHIYHKDCIAKWLRIKKTCPICNNELQISSNLI
ncbi:E3 ubiquitin-protein ligase BIG BROTHER-like isoform X2 [Andrographis paniculata]|uniref:E3 ubiquitin-protein ligase BIG BROTHER-like isoform X2 n=1 Tax=Andrographis paniculata TaxID=175694 RepID=UPI0021E8ED03|nr:E3 ubiquitin-protein ligase BIG BROTHER-like isoform X2 [Andrographis paniculata]